MAEKGSSVSVGVDDLIATSAEGVLRALDARKIAGEKLSMSELVKSGFIVDIRIICGGLNPATIAGLQNNQK